MAFFVAPNLFYLFFRDPTGRVTPQQLKHLFADRGIVATGEKERLALRWGNGPVLYASIVRDGTAGEYKRDNPELPEIVDLIQSCPV
jgi:hypothetical protein